MLIAFKSAIPFLDIYAKEILTYAYKKACTSVFMSAVLIRVKNDHKTNH